MKRTILFLLIIFFSYLPVFAAPEPHVLVIFGATGDLTQKKLIPALFHLSEDNKLPENFVYIAVGRKEKSSQEFQNDIRQAIGKSANQETLQKIINKCFYYRLDFEQPQDFEKFNDYLKKIDQEHGTEGNRLFYLATPPSNFPSIIENLHHHDMLTHADTQWSRVVIEKPFGKDLESAAALQKHISQFLNENQIYLIDHYLGKEAVQNLPYFRFKNPLIESIWNHHFIDNVQITLSEDIGIGSRGKFWEETGLLRDIVQNHLIQLLALIAMEPPENFDASTISNQKADLIESIRPFSLEVDPTIIRGQYDSGVINHQEVKAYREENDVPKASNRETFVAAKLFVDTPRWQNVPFYIRAGKRLAKKYTEIVINFKTPFSTMFNHLIIRIQPDENITLYMHSAENKVYKHILKPTPSTNKRIPEAYENLLQECMNGNQKLFVTIREILMSWQLFTPVLQYWEKYPQANFPNYSSGSWGPLEADHLLEKEGHHWHQTQG